MYRCAICDSVSKPGERANRVPLRTRRKVYDARSNSQPTGKRKDRSRRGRWRADPGGIGFEIVAEAVVCTSCYGQHEPVAETEPTVEVEPQPEGEVYEDEGFRAASGM